MLPIPKSSKKVFQGTIRGAAVCVPHAFHPKVSQPSKRHSTPTFKVRSATRIHCVFASTAFFENAKVLTSGGSNLRCSRTHSERRTLLSSYCSENTPRNAPDRSSCDSAPQCVELLCLQVRSTLRLLDHVLRTLEPRSATFQRSPGSAGTGTSQGSSILLSFKMMISVIFNDFRPQNIISKAPYIILYQFLFFRQIFLNKKRV